MDFVELINESQLSLISCGYSNFLWSKINEELTSISTAIGDEEQYRAHLPLDLNKFLKHCVSKLRELRNNTNKDIWQILNEKYISTLIFFILEEEEGVTLTNALNAANIFILLNVIDIPEKQLFFKVTYLKVLELLNRFNNSGNLPDKDFILLMNEFKDMLQVVTLPEDTITSTVAVLHSFTYSCSKELTQISTEVSLENCGYIAFVSLKILAEKLALQKREKNLYPIVLCLMSSLKSAPIGNLQGSDKTVHQKNVILFIKDNWRLFHSNKACLIMDALKTVCLSSEYNNNEAIATLVQNLPSEIYHDFFHFFGESLLCSREDFKKNCLDLVVPFLRHPAEYESNTKRLIKSEIILNHVVMLFADKNEDIRTKALKIVADYSEDTIGRRILRKLMGPENFADVNRDTVQNILYKSIDLTWSKKKLNVSYVQFICNLFIIRKDLVTIKGLNRLRNVCLNASPFDIKSCIVHLKRLLEYHSSDKHVVMYVLSIFSTQMFHTMSTSSLFAKELSDLIFSNLTVNDNESFIWNILDHLISHNFPVYSIFEKFYSLQLLQDRYVRILMEYKIQENSSRTTALKLLCIMVNFVKYSKTHLLEEILEEWIIGNQINLSPTDVSLVVYALSKMMEKKRKSDCNHSDLQNYRQMQHLVCQTFFEQAFPAITVHYVVVLLSSYARLIEEDAYWDSSACASFEEELRTKLNDISNTILENHVYLFRDVAYIGELILIKKTALSSATFNLLKRIATASEHNRMFSEYLKSHEEIWSLCIMLYIKACFIDRDLIESCVDNLVYILLNRQLTEYSKLKILYALYDICAMHLEYYDPVIPFLFQMLNDKNDYVRFISAKIIIKMTQNEHLRLLDGKYFIFMSLLADKNHIIVQTVQMFVRNYFAKNCTQTIAGSFIPSVIHYNLCYSYPGISLLENERELLKLKKDILVNRKHIYFHLFQHLPSNIKFNVVHQISKEILSKFTNKKFSQIPEALNLLEDTLSITLLIVPVEKIQRINRSASYLEEEIKQISGLFSYVENSGKQIDNKMEKIALRSVFSNLLQILYSDQDHNKDVKICQNVLFAILALKKNFEAVVKQILHEDSNLKELFSSLKKFFYKSKELFEDCNVTIIPQLSSIREDDKEFYWKEMSDFTFIHPCKIIGNGS